MPLCRPPLGTRVSVRRLTKNSRPGPRAPPPSTVTSSAFRITGESDVASLIRAECTDELFTMNNSGTPSSSGGGVLHTDSAVPRHAGNNLLNHFNSAAWLSALPVLHARGALTASDEAGARRYLAGPTFQALLPWLWETATTATATTDTTASTTVDAEDDDASGRADDWETEPTSLHDGIQRRLASLSAATTATTSHTPREIHVDELRTARPSQWGTLVSGWLQQSANGAESEEARLARLPKWHQAFFALSANPALNGTASELTAAHRFLLDVVELFYADASAVQQSVSPPLISSMTAAASREASDTHAFGAGRTHASPAVVCSTRMPPILLRRWRRLYRTHGAYLLFSDVFRTCVEGEQKVVQIMTSKANATAAATASDDGDFPQVPVYTTALLQDAELFIFYLSIPGRRETDLPWEEQWRWTLSYTYVAFRWLFRMQSLALYKAARTQSGARSRPRSHARGDVDKDDAEASWRALRQALSTLMNVTVWVRNNNDEGNRCQAALRTVLQAYWDTLDGDAALAATHTTEEERDERHAQAQWQRTETLLTTFRQVSLESMDRKLEALHFAPSRGLLDVATLLTAVESAKPESPAATEHDAPAATPEALRRWRQTLAVLLTGRETGVAGAWQAVCDSAAPCLATRKAARYALVTLGCRLFHTVLTAARVEPSLGTAQRLLRELGGWVAHVGRPLRLCAGEVSPLWLYQLQRREAKSAPSSSSSWAQTWHTLLSSTKGSAPEPWTCGCGYTNRALAEAVAAGGPARGLSCASCVNRDLRPFTWECDACHWVNATGEAALCCLQCGHAHPALPTDVDKMVSRQVSPSRQCSHAQLVPVLVGATTAPVDAEHRLAHARPVVMLPAHTTQHTCSCCVDCGLVVDSPAESSQQQQQRHSVIATGALPCAQPLLRCCPDCGTATVVAMPDTNAATPSSTRCLQCRSTRVYWRGLFSWRCGCGASNHPGHHHCWACTHERGDGAAVYTCPDCQEEVVVQDDASAPRDARGACTHCHHAHPCVGDATAMARLVDCPSCHNRMPADADACPRCRSTLIRLVRPLLETEADQPWSCHACGHTHTLRDAATGALTVSHRVTTTPSPTTASVAVQGLASLAVAMPGSSGGVTPSAGQVCEQCHAARTPVAVWEHGRAWQCDHCGDAVAGTSTSPATTTSNTDGQANSHVGVQCGHCLQLAPGVAPEAVSCWECVDCGEWSMSWMSACARFGCGALQATHTRTRRAYARWECAACGGWSLALPSVHECAHCGAAAPASTHVDSQVTTSPTRSSVDGAHDRLGMNPPSDGAAVERSGVPLVAPARAVAEQRLNDVEALLLHAAKHTPPPAPPPPQQQTHVRHDMAVDTTAGVRSLRDASPHASTDDGDALQNNTAPAHITATLQL